MDTEGQEYTFDSADLHTLMDLVSEKLQSVTQDDALSDYATYLNDLKNRVRNLWAEVLPGQEVAYTIREQPAE